MTALDLLHPRLCSHPDAADFAAVLADCHEDVLPLFEGVGSYAWEADIPPRDEWNRHAEEFAAHVAELEAS